MRNTNMRNTKQVKHKWWHSALNEKGFLVNNGGCIKGKAHHFSLEVQAMPVASCLVWYDTNTRWDMHKYLMRNTQIQNKKNTNTRCKISKERPIISHRKCRPCQWRYVLQWSSMQFDTDHLICNVIRQSAVHFARQCFVSCRIEDSTIHCTEK